MALPTVSILISTYLGEKAENLKRALESLLSQTLPPLECVLVIDGPVDGDQEDVIEHLLQRPTPTRLIVKRLMKNGGLARALNVGLAHCRGDLIARMDSDDVCRPDRIEVQARRFADAEDIDVLCSWSGEFEDDPASPTYVKRTPTSHERIVASLRWRNPIAHPTIMVRRKALERIGGYCNELLFLQDYDLYVRLIMSGARFEAVQQPLVFVRTGPGQRARRSGWHYIREEIGFRWSCYRNGFVSAPNLALTIPAYTAFRLTPPQAKGFLYLFVRNRTKKDAATIVTEMEA